VEVWVQDDGGGVPQGFLPRLFERFARADLARSSQGFGLGLSLSQAIAAAHGGSIRYESTEPVGCRFTLSIARGDAEESTPVAEAAEMEALVTSRTGAPRPR
jgi:signal transduction histidine kinase